MHEALILIARAIALAHDRWRHRIGRRRTFSGMIAVLEEGVARLEAENNLLRSRFLAPPRRIRPPGGTGPAMPTSGRTGPGGPELAADSARRW